MVQAKPESAASVGKPFSYPYSIMENDQGGIRLNEITVVVVGYEEDQLTDAGKRALREAERVILHTEQCGCASWLQKQGIAYSTLDYLYDATEDFDDHAIVVAETLIDAAKQTPVCYAVFNFRDRSLGELLNRAGNITRFIGGSDPAAVLLAGVCSGVLDVSASEWSSLKLTSSEGVLIRELDRREIACELKLRLMDVYPEETDVAVLMSNGEIAHLPLYTLDRLTK